MRKKFKMDCGLWITPNFSDVLEGRRTPPRVDHDHVDFEAFQIALCKLFRFGPPVRIQVPNDTIDQVTVHVRQGRRTGATIRCEDFGRTLLLAKPAKATTIDVRQAWAPLHALPDRTFAPPPVILPFLAQAEDFEDAMLWQANTLPALGLPVFDRFSAGMGLPGQQNAEGTLPAAFRERLAQLFDTPYDTMCVLDRMACDHPPAEYGFSESDFRS